MSQKENFKKISDLFLNGKTGKSGDYVAVKNALVFRKIVDCGKGDYKLKQNVIAVRTPSGLMIGNSSVLPLIGRRVAFGNEQLNRDLTPVQEYISQKIQMLPFTVFAEANLDLMRTKILDRGNEETLTIMVDSGKRDKNWNPIMVEESRHFTGASLFQVEDKVFLFDIDRNEIKHKIFNPFLVELTDTTVKTIKDAYESLKPSEVRAAEREGKNVLRQGEWFLIPLEMEYIAQAQNTTNTWVKPLVAGYATGELRAGDNRPNRVGKYAVNEKNEIIAVSGPIEHSGREHKALNLKQWYKPIPNTSVQSWTISGNID